MTTLSPQQRRVLANLSQPRSLGEVTRELLRDRYAPFETRGAGLANEVAAVLRELEAADLAANVGVVETALDAVQLVDSDPRVPTLHPEKAHQFIDRHSPGTRDAWKLAEGEMWYWTEAGREALSSS